MTPEENNLAWEEKFDELAHAYFEPDGSKKDYWAGIEFSKSFIQSLLDKSKEEGRQEAYENNLELYKIAADKATAEERSRLLKEVEGMMKKRQFPLANKIADRIYDCDVTAYNQAIKDVAKRLR